MAEHRIVLVQLPIPPPGPVAIRGNIPLAAGYLKMYARHMGVDDGYDIDIFPPSIANTHSDLGIVEAILERNPWMVGFTCYLWNIDRTLWIASSLKERRPDLKILIGGPEVTADNSWVLATPAVDFAAIGEGEQTFSELLATLKKAPIPQHIINGLHVRGRTLTAPPFRNPLPRLDEISSPYLVGILDAADERMMLLETIRGCIFKCKFCYYPKSYDSLYFVSKEKVVANLRHASERGAREVVLLDPTLNQRKDFGSFLELLAECNPNQQFTYFGELRGEGVTEKTAKLLKKANFSEVEIGLQSVDPHAQELMDRHNNLKAFEKGSRAMMKEGIKVKVDLIVGLPGDTAETIRAGMKYLKDGGLYDDIQVFNLAILPGTAFRQEAQQLGLKFQPRPPYYALKTPTLELAQMYELIQEAQEYFGIEFDPFPEPMLEFLPSETWSRERPSFARCCRIDLESSSASLGEELPPPVLRSQAFTLWLRGDDYSRHGSRLETLIRQVLKENPHTTLQIVFDPKNSAAARSLTPSLLQSLIIACQEQPTYLDRMYSLQPGGQLGAKRMVVVLPFADRQLLGWDWIDDVGEFASISWLGESAEDDEFEPFEYVQSEPAVTPVA